MGGFRKFLMRDNMMDLAMAVVVGVAFNSVVQALIRDLVNPLLQSAGGKPNFAALSITINHKVFNFGEFVNAVVSFLVILGAIYFVIVLPASRLTKMAERRTRALIRDCPECLSEIPSAATRCRYCTAVVTPTADLSDGQQALTLRDRLPWLPRNL